MWLLRKVIRAPGGVRQLFYELGRENNTTRNRENTEHPAQDKVM